MRKVILLACACALLNIVVAQNHSLSLSAATTNNNVSKEQVSDEWYAKATSWLNDQQTNFRKLDETTYGVINNQHRFGSFITASGYTIKSISSGQDNDWQANFELLSINDMPFSSEGAVAALSGKRLAFEKPNMTVEYLNSKEGMRQNFIVNEKPRNSESLFLAIRVSTSLNVVADKAKLILTDASGSTKLIYDELKVWDAKHRLLNAAMKLQDGLLIISVDDAGATYPVTVDPLNHSPNWTDNGNGLLFPLLNDLTAHVLFGFSVGNSGDVNNDGYDDVIIGAPGFVDILNVSAGTFNLVSVGAAFIYYGSASGPSATPGEVLQPTSAVGALMGYSVSCAGDVNGDGYDDVVIGAPGDHVTLNVGIIPVATSVAAGRIYIYYGGAAGSFDANVNTEPSVSVSIALQQSDFGALLAVPINPLYGFSVNTAGDVNGDGYADIVVGAPAYNRLLPLPLRSGRVDVYYGAAGGITAGSGNTITGTLPSALFGFSVSTAGNVNNDKNAGRNIDDIIVGAPGDLTFLGAGQAYIFHGSTSGITVTSASAANTTLSSGILTTLFGFSVSTAGDVNGDGFSDVIVGEPGALENFLSQLVSVGAARIYRGTAAGVSTMGSIGLSSPHRPSLLGLLEGNLLYGFSVRAAGDVNCDGLGDVVVGEPGGTALSLGTGILSLVSTNSLSGRTYIYFGIPSTGPVNTPGYTVEEMGPVSVANFIGYSVSGAGDINNDGRPDILIGAPNGTVSLAGTVIPMVGQTVNIVTTNSIGSSYIYNGCLSAIVLPLSVTEFSARKSVTGGVAINWTSEQEQGVSHYILEYSTNGADFSPMAIFFPQGRSVNHYIYDHTNPATVNYYRLKIIDANGAYRYSGIRTVKFTEGNKQLVTVYPNPSSEVARLQLDNFEKGQYQVKLINTSGQVEFTSRITIQNDHHEEALKVSMMKAGLYRVMIIDAQGKRVSTAQLIVGQ